MLNMLLTCVLKISPMLIMFKRKEISKCLQGNCAFQWHHHHHPVVAIDSTETPANTSESEEGRGELAYYYFITILCIVHS